MKNIAPFEFEIIGYKENYLVKSVDIDRVRVPKAVIIRIKTRKYNRTFAITPDGQIIGDFWSLGITEKDLTDLIVNSYLASAIIQYAQSTNQQVNLAYDKNQKQFNIVVSTY